MVHYAGARYVPWSRALHRARGLKYVGRRAAQAPSGRALHRARGLKFVIRPRIAPTRP